MFARFRTLIVCPKILNNELCVKLNGAMQVGCTDPFRVDKRYRFKQWPNNWLPFKWERPEQIPGYFNTGDPSSTEGLPKFDSGKLQPFFDGLEDLKNAPEDVKKLFTLGMLPRSEIVNVLVEDQKTRFQRHPFDDYSPESKVAKYTLRIRATQEVLRKHPNNSSLKRNIICMAGKRKKWLNVLYRFDKKRYDLVVKSLNINNTPSPIGVIEYERIERKKELRRLTREYCEKIRKEKLSKYHEFLKEEQIRFIKEKKETEEWITETLKKFNLKDPRCGEIV